MIWTQESLEGKKERLKKWHRWFAWYPVRVATNGVDKFAWLQYVERRKKFFLFVYDWYWETEYRLINSE